MIKHVLAFILFASPCLAGMGIGGFPYPGPGEMLESAPSGIFDNFNTDTSENYTAINGSISISGGSLGGGTAWTQNYAYHETPTGSNDHYVQGKLQTGGPDAGGMIGLRSNGTTGYLVNLSSTGDRLYLRSFNGAPLASVVYWPVTSPPGAGIHLVKVSVSGSTFSAWIDLDGNGSTETSLGNITDTTYSTGQYVVVGALRGADNVDYRVDDLAGGL